MVKIYGGENILWPFPVMTPLMRSTMIQLQLYIPSNYMCINITTVWSGVSEW